MTEEYTLDELILALKETSRDMDTTLRTMHVGSINSWRRLRKGKNSD